MVLAVMQSATFFAGERAAHYQFRVADQVAQLQQIRADVEVCIVFLDLILQ